MQKWVRFLARVPVGIITLIILILIAVFISRFVNSRKVKITTENGINENSMVEIGGIKQYLQIRGQNKDNPVVIFLHGGPGSPMTYINYTYQTPLEENYTFVSWDQRGCGRTFYANPEIASGVKLTRELLLKDLDEIVEYSRKRFNQDKVIIFGHSWGTVLGSEYVQIYPEKVKAYLGVGQGVDVFKGYRMAANKAMELANEKNNTEDANLLSEIAAQLTSPTEENSYRLKEIMKVQMYIRKYMPYESKSSDLGQMWMGITAPNFLLDDVKWYLTLMDLNKYITLESTLIEEFVNSDISRLGNKYKVPMYYISGEADWQTPRIMVEEYYKKVESPDKAMVIIKDAGHSPFVDQPEQYQEAFKSLLSRAK
jgi:pimeloyl-ACP methyl ester carboxylesterase